MAAAADPHRLRRVLRGALATGTVVLTFGAAWQIGMLVHGSVHRHSAASPPRAAAVGQRSVDCRRCHVEEFRAWAASDHAHAHRPVDAVADAPAFQPARRFAFNGVQYGVGWSDGKPSFTEQRGDAAPEKFTADFVLGHSPLRQYVVPVGRGRYQLTELAFDPAKREWFNVFGADQRQPGDWGHWRGRGMNWNSMCAHCHLTDFAKNYDAATDTYRSTWLEHGVGCLQCHGPITAAHLQPGYTTSPSARARLFDGAQTQQTCAPCHARNEWLTGEPRPGMAYFDHFRVTLPTDPAMFYPDGQVREEDFNWTSLLTSRMGGHAGISCLDCHEPHSGKTRLPAANNALCLQCHGSPNAKHAPIIDPVAHSHHQPGSAGNACIACHMPTTTYMQRDPRHDHGFLKPDPLLTKELGIPNACDRCHATSGIDWQIDAAQKWYGAKLDSRQRERARAVAAAQQRDPTAVERLLRLIATEDVPAWKASLLQLAIPWAERNDVTAAGTDALKDASPLVRDAAVLLLSASESGSAQTRPALSDPSRLVRLDAEWAQAATLAEGSAEDRELQAYLRMMADQPTGQLRLAQYLARGGNLEQAKAPLRTAIQWEPKLPILHETLGRIENAAGDSPAAAAELWRAAQLDPRDAPVAFDAGLAFAAAGQWAEAEQALRSAVACDPTLHRAWYNLGLLLAQQHRPTEALAALRKAEAAAPKTPEYSYAIATVLWSIGNQPAADAAAQRQIPNAK
jgi:predicted CXXCH cytochrome family protein